MKSLLITFDFPPVISGISTFFFNVWKLLPKENNLILVPKIKNYQEIDSSAGLKIYRFFSFYKSRFLRAVCLLFKTWVILKKEKIDILICASPVVALIRPFFKRLMNLPFCVFYYGGELKKYKNNKLLKNLLIRILKESRFIVTNSEFTSQEVKEIGIDQDKIFKITPGVDTDAFKPDLDSTDLRKQFGLNNKKVLLSVCRLVKRKGIDTVIKSLVFLKKQFPDLSYLVVGVGKEESFLKMLVRENGLDNNVVFVGSVSQKELPRFYNLSDIYVMPNRETEGEEIVEGFGASFIEASACGKPVIGGRSGGAVESIEDGITGILVDPLNIDEVSGAIIKLITDEEYARRLGHQGRTRVEEKFRWETVAGKMKDLISK